MTAYENDCCDCATESYPCMGNACKNRNVPHYYCDECGDETKLYEFEGEDLCTNCVLKRLDVVEGSG